MAKNIMKGHKFNWKTKGQLTTPSKMQCLKNPSMHEWLRYNCKNILENVTKKEWLRFNSTIVGMT